MFFPKKEKQNINFLFLLNQHNYWHNFINIRALLVALLCYFCEHNLSKPNYYQQNIESIEFLLLQTHPNCLGRSWNPFTKTTREVTSPVLHSKFSGDSGGVKPILTSFFLSEACPYPQSSLMMPNIDGRVILTAKVVRNKQKG